jgi:ATP-dependent Clp protease ATP-binding subunit ClpB
MISFDMAEYKDPTSINRLIGASPGYVGYEQESKLISCIRSNPNSIIVMDGIEEAHPDVLGVLRQIFEKGTLATQDGETVFFSYATFILISNIGAEVLKEENFKNLEYDIISKQVRAILEDAVKKSFNPSFLNAIDKVIYFSPLKREWMTQIVLNKIQTVFKRLESRGYKVTLKEEVIDFLVEKGYSIQFGAKAINKVIENELLKPLTQYILSCDKGHITVSLSKGSTLAFSCGLT